ncbi:LLM class flavin-dependent oxidoreductase [Rhodococcus koreensis]
MRTAITIEALSGKWTDNRDLALEGEKVGLDICWVAEAWGSDVLTPLGYLAARTERMLLGTGATQLGTRTPVAIAAAALTLAEMSGNRFLLGIGSSGPQVIEGLHGQSFAHPLQRMRETVEIIRLVFSGGKVRYEGRHFQIPRPGGEGVPMKMALEPNLDIPIYIAALSPKMLELTGEIADGWLGSSFVPEGARAYLDPLEAGATRAGRTLADLDISQGAEVNFVDNEKALSAVVATRKKELAFSLGGMGSTKTNFYNAAYSRQGWREVAADVHQLWQSGDKDGATDLITDEMVLTTTLIGTEEMIRNRLTTWQNVGVSTVRFYPAGETTERKVTNLARAIEMVKEISTVPTPAAT